MVMGDMELETETLVIGGGPGGYAAAFRSADLGQDVTLVNPEPLLGGVCLFAGCIPSKTLLVLTELIRDARNAAGHGVAFDPPRIDLERIRAWKQSVIDDLAEGLLALNKRRGIELVSGTAVFEDSHSIRLDHSEIRRIRFRQAVVATGSQPICLPGFEFAAGSRIMDSEAALQFADIPERLLIVGGGYVGLELGTVYAALGSSITVVEREQHILPGVDRDLVRPLEQSLMRDFSTIKVSTSVAGMEETADGVKVMVKSGEGEQSSEQFDRVMIAIGRKPRSSDLGLEKAGLRLDPNGFISVDDRQRSSVPHIFAVGDVTGGMMLAHKAVREGRVAAEVICGQPSAFDVRAIPAVVYTDPQIAWCGLTEEQAARDHIDVAIRRFPWRYSGRARTMGATEGLTKLILNPVDGRVLGLGASGRNAEGLISEGVLAIEMGALAEDLALCIHPHPTLAETAGEAAELFLGSATHMAGK